MILIKLVQLLNLKVVYFFIFKTDFISFTKHNNIKKFTLKKKVTHFFLRLWKSYLDFILSIIIVIFALTSE